MPGPDVIGSGRTPTKVDVDGVDGGPGVADVIVRQFVRDRSHGNFGAGSPDLKQMDDSASAPGATRCPGAGY